MKSPKSTRLGYIDWMRGLACVLMFQTHCYDAWLRPVDRHGDFLKWSQLGGTLPAPLFLFLAGISVALIADKMRRNGAVASQIGWKLIRRGMEILALGLLFRLQEYVIAWGWAPWSDLLRVDVLNVIGVSIMMMGALVWVVLALSKERVRLRLGLGSVGVAALIAVVTPLLWTTWRPTFLLWPLESYINGVHNLGAPQAWLFPIFPWTAFAFAGLATGCVLVSDVVRRWERVAYLLVAPAGVVLIAAALWLDSRATSLYPVYDFWHTSPNFFLIRVGLLLVILTLSYAWCRWGLGQVGFSPLIQLGQTSLLVYWVHIEFVYGRFTILPHQGVGIGTASAGLAVIFVAMLILSLLRTRIDWAGLFGRGTDWWAALRRPFLAG